MNLSITNATIGEIKTLLGLFSSNLQFTLDDEVEKLISKNEEAEPVLHVEVDKEQVINAVSEQLQKDFEDFSLLEDDPDFTEIKPTSGSEDLEQLHLDSVPVPEKTYTKNELFKLATELSNKGGQSLLLTILKEYNIQALPQLQEADFNSFGAKLELVLKELN